MTEQPRDGRWAEVDYANAFLSSRAYSKATQESYRYCLNRLGTWLQERGKTLDDLDADLYLVFLNSHGWSNNMRRLYGSVIRAFKIWLDGDKRSPIHKIKLPKDDAMPGRALNERKLSELLASFDTSTPLGWRDLAIVALMVETGLRASEICNLELARVDMEERKFFARVKGQKVREGVFSEDTARFLAVWLTLRPQFALPGVKTLFVSVRGEKPGTPLTAAGLRALFRKFGKRAEIGRLSPHDMRRTMACLLTESEAPTRLVQLLGGWEDIRMVERYTRRLKPDHIDRYSPIRLAFGSFNVTNRKEAKRDQ